MTFLHSPGDQPRVSTVCSRCKEARHSYHRDPAESCHAVGFKQQTMLVGGRRQGEDTAAYGVGFVDGRGPGAPKVLILCVLLMRYPKWGWGIEGVLLRLQPGRVESSNCWFRTQHE